MPASTDVPFVSVIVPVRNMGKTIWSLMESLMNLDYPKDCHEIILVDGDSKDDTREIVKEYPVALIDQEGRGCNAARNTGVKHSKGEIIAFTDGDCIVPPNWIRLIASNFTDPGVNFVGGLVRAYDRLDPLSVYLEETFFPITPRFRWRTETTNLGLLHFPAGANMAFRRRALEKIGFFDERIFYGFEDLDAVEELGKRGFKIVLDPEVVVWHQHRTSLREILKQHFNYGRGGTLLLVHKRASQLAHWFAIYLIYSSFVGISIFVFLMTFGVMISHPLPIQVGLWLFMITIASIQLYYVPLALKTKRLRKILLYPLLDFARGFGFTFGGLIQLFWSLGQRVTR